MLHQAPAIDRESRRKYEQAAEKIWAACFERSGDLGTRKTRPVIAISGAPGCGKSSIAYYLCRLFMHQTTRKAKHLWADDLYSENYLMMDPTKRELRRTANKFRDIGPEEYNWQEIALILDAFKNGGRCRMPCVDVMNQQIDWLETDFQEIGLLVLEGLYVVDMARNTLRADCKLFIEGSTAPDQDKRDQERKTSERRQIVAAEQRAIEQLKHDRIRERDLIVLTYDEHARVWNAKNYYP